MSFFGAGFFQAYLISYVYWLAFPLGASALLMIYRLTGGNWGECTLAYTKAASRTLGPFALLFIPVLLAQGDIYPWTQLAVRATMHGGNRIYLTEPFFAVRTVIYFLAWFALILGTLRRGSPVVRALSAGGLVFYGFSTSFASFDWQMSLEPGWHSTVYGLIFGIAMILECWAGILLVISVRGEFARQNDKTQRDVSNLLLAFVMVWAYLSFVQYLIIWCGNMPEEASWMYYRTHNGWQVLALALVVMQFGLPFALLLFRNIKTRAKNVARIASIVLVARLIEQYWYVEPSLHTDRVMFNAWVVPTFIGLGAIWLALFKFNFIPAELNAAEELNG